MRSIETLCDVVGKYTISRQVTENRIIVFTI